MDPEIFIQKIYVIFNYICDILMAVFPRFDGRGKAEVQKLEDKA